MKKRAILIGINKYKYYEKYPLDGCINDVKIMASVLKQRFGFTNENIRLLKDEEATRDAIVKEMQHILDTCETDSMIVFHFSGHGTRRIASEANKPDGLEETIIPYDSSPHPHSNLDIRDSDIRNWLTLLTKKTRNICIFCDSCYSGSITRNQEKIRGVETDSKENLLSLNQTLGQQVESINIFPTSSVNWLSHSNSYSLIAACRKDEYAREYTHKKGESYGALTYFLVEELRKAPLYATYQDVFEKLCINMRLRYPSQHPQIEGNNNRQLFTDIEHEGMKYVVVNERTENEIVLGAGVSHGLTNKSVWMIYQSSTKHPIPEEKVGKVKITEVGIVTSKAKIIEEKANKKIEAGCRAIEKTHYYPDKKFAVFLDSQTYEFKQIKKIIADDIKKSSWLKITDIEKNSDFTVALGAIEEKQDRINKTRIIIRQTRDGQVLWEMLNFDVDYLNKIRQILEKLSRFSMVSDLQNPISKLRDLVEFTLLQKKNEIWGDVKDFYNNLPLYFEGDQIGFQVINKSSIPIYFSLLDLGLTKKIELLYPKAHSERIENYRSAGGVIQNPDLGVIKVGILPNERLTLFIPEESLLTRFHDINSTGGIEIFKLMITTEQTNFSWIEQTGVRGIKKFNSSLEKLMYRFLSKRQTREAHYEIEGHDDWLTINRCFYLCKR